jgi:hypothetical protein
MLQYSPGTCHELCYLPSSHVLCHKHKHSLVTAGDQSVAANLHKRNEKQNKALQHATNAPTRKLVCSPHNIVRNRTSLATHPPFLTFHTILHS